jgi:hypothetical protein
MGRQYDRPNQEAVQADPDAPEPGAPEPDAPEPEPVADADA